MNLGLPTKLFGSPPGPDEPKPDPAVVAELSRMLRTMDRVKLALVGLVMLCLGGAVASTLVVSRGLLLWGSFSICILLSLVCGFVLRGVDRAYWRLHAKYDRFLCLGAHYEVMKRIRRNG